MSKHTFGTRIITLKRALLKDKNPTATTSIYSYSGIRPSVLLIPLALLKCLYGDKHLHPVPIVSAVQGEGCADIVEALGSVYTPAANPSGTSLFLSMRICPNRLTTLFSSLFLPGWGRSWLLGFCGFLVGVFVFDIAGRKK